MSLKESIRLNTGGSVLLALDVFGGDSVEDSSSLIGDDSRVEFEGISFLVFLDDFLLFELLESPSDDFEGSVLVLGSSGWHSLLSSEKVR